MKAISFAVASFVALVLVGCADASSPVQTDNTPSPTSLSLSGGDESNTGLTSTRSGKIEGIIREIDITNGLVTIGSTVVRTNSSTKIEKNGFHTTLSQFNIGDRGQARYNAGASVAWKVDAISM